MTEENAVEETNGQSATGAAAAPTEREDDLDQLLNEFDEGTKPKPEETKASPEPKKEPDDLDDLRRFAKDYQQRELDREISATVKGMKDRNETLNGLSDAFVEARLNWEASKDPRLQSAWVNRHQNPQAWEKVLDGLGRKLSGEIASRPDPQLTNDRDAARAAVRGTSTQPAEDPKPKNSDMAKMSDAEFEAYKKGLLKAG